MFTEAQIIAFFQRLVLTNCLKSDRDYELAKNMFRQHFDIDYEGIIDNGHLSDEIDENIRLAKKKK